MASLLVAYLYGLRHVSYRPQTCGKTRPMAGVVDINVPTRIYSHQ